MSGTSRSYWPVISMMRTTPVMGARAAPEKTAPMPMTPKTAAAVGESGAASIPIAAPSIPPMHRDGAKTPPANPVPSVTEVATALAAASPSRAAAV